MKVDPLLINAEGHKECLLGNEAIVRAALESEVAFASGYPGTPSSEVTDSFSRIAKPFGLHFEYSINEKIALETAFAASLTGARSICAMKHLGLMYAGDPLSTIPYIGVKAGLVIVSAGDPSCRTSPNEQDQRHLGPMLHLLTLDPSTPREAYEMTRFAFELSEKSRMPVVLRVTTRVCHTRGVISYGRLSEPKVTGFEKDPKRLVPLPSNARNLRVEIEERLKTAQHLMAESGFNYIQGKGKFKILASGSPAASCADIIDDRRLGDKVSLLTLGTVYPLPKEQIMDFLSQADEALVVEELSPYLENAILSICAQEGIQIKINGKLSGHLPIPFEYEPEIINKAISRCLGLEDEPESEQTFPETPIRPPILCAGCSHRNSYFAAKAVFGDEHLYFNDIGCYTLGYGPPLQSADALLSMGASFSMASAVSRVSGQKTVAFMGDSTFFHSGIPALINAIKEDCDMTAVILDNQVTAMTGFQESPGVEIEGNSPVRNISIEAIVNALGAKKVVTVDPYDLKATIEAFQEAANIKGTSVVITKHPCLVFMSRYKDQKAEKATYQVDESLCQTCGKEADGLRCDREPSNPFQRHMCKNRLLAEQPPKSETAPCGDQCPLGLCVQGYVGQIAAGNYQDAFEVIMKQCSLPETVCRVCHQPCQTACVRKDLDEPVAVNDLKRFVIEQSLKNNFDYQPERRDDKNLKVAIVGAGPSGLATAHDLILRGYQTTIFDSEEKPGGLLSSGIPDYRLPEEALNRDINRILDLGVNFKGGAVLGRDFSLDELLADGYQAIYLGIGAHKASTLGWENSLPSDSKLKAIESLAYLKAVNHGKKAPSGRRVLVVGGGNAAIDAARTAKRLGAETVSVIYRRRKEEMPAIKEEIEAAEEEGVIIKTQLQPAEPQTEGTVGMKCVKTKPGEPDESGRSRPVPIMETEFLIEADLIISAIGQNIETDSLATNKQNLELAEGLLKVNPNNTQTSHPLIFAGGDLTDEQKTVTDAIAWGKLAAWGIDSKLSGEEQAGIQPPSPALKPKVPPSLNLTAESFIPQQRPETLDVKQRTSGFAEVRKPLTEEQARQEAERCVVCGLCGNCRSCVDLFGCPAFYLENNQVKIDKNLCAGCGLCAHICPNNAIKKVEL